MNKIVSIRCKSYYYVATQLIKLNQTIKYFCYQQKYGSYLILSVEQLSEEELEKINTEHLPAELFTNVDKTIPPNHLCYSFKLENLQQMQKPYEYMAKIITQLKYPFSKVKIICDPYGDLLLILFN